MEMLQRFVDTLVCA